MAKKTMTAEERAARKAALEDIRKECGELMEDITDYDYTEEDLETLELLRELGF